MSRLTGVIVATAMVTGGLVATFPAPNARAATPALPSFVAVAGGPSHTVALSSVGQVFAWGANDHGQVGTGGTSPDPQTVPTAVALPDDLTITAIDAGTDWSVALTADGDLYTWGDNSFGRLGTGSSEGYLATPTRVDLPESAVVAQVSAGAEHGLAVLSGGELYAWGHGNNYQLGRTARDRADHASPVEVIADPVLHGDIRPLTGVARVSAGAEHSLALMTSGDVLGWGLNGSGQLGLVSAYAAVPTPLWCVGGPCDALGAVADVVAGAASSFVLWGPGPNLGKVMAVGDNGGGQLGTGLGDPQSLTAAYVQLNAAGTDLTNIVQLAAAGNTVLARSGDGLTYSWGRGDAGQRADADLSAGQNVAKAAGLVRPLAAAWVATTGANSFVISTDQTEPVCLTWDSGSCSKWDQRGQSGGLYGVGTAAQASLGALRFDRDANRHSVQGPSADAMVNVTLMPGTVSVDLPPDTTLLEPGDVVTAKTANWPRDVAVTYAWTYADDGSPAAGQPNDAATYTMVEADLGHELVVTISPVGVAPGDVNWIDQDGFDVTSEPVSTIPVMDQMILDFPADVTAEAGTDLTVDGLTQPEADVTVTLFDDRGNVIASDLIWVPGPNGTGTITGTVPDQAGNYRIVIEATALQPDQYGRYPEGRAEIAFVVTPGSGNPELGDLVVIPDVTDPKPGDTIHFEVWETDDKGNPIRELPEPWQVISCTSSNPTDTCSSDGTMVIGGVGDRVITVIVSDGVNQREVTVVIAVAPGPLDPSQGLRLITTDPTDIILGESITLMALGSDKDGNDIDLTALAKFTSDVELDNVLGAVVTPGRIGLRLVTATYKSGATVMTSEPVRVVAFSDGLVIEEMPSLTPPQAMVGQTMTASGGGWNPVATALTYQWLVDGAPILGATTPAYTPSSADLGKQLSIQVAARAEDNLGTGRVTVEADGPVVPVPAPEPTPRPSQTATTRPTPATALGPQSVEVTKVVPKLTVKAKPKRVKPRAKFKVTVTVKAVGIKAVSGKVKIKFKGKQRTVKLKAKGTVKVTFRAPAKPARYTIKATYLGNARVAKRTLKSTKLTVR